MATDVKISMNGKGLKESIKGELELMSDKQLPRLKSKSSHEAAQINLICEKMK